MGDSYGKWELIEGTVMGTIYYDGNYGRGYYRRVTVKFSAFGMLGLLWLLVWEIKEGLIMGAIYYGGTVEG